MQSVTRFLKPPVIAIFAAACLCVTPAAKANVYATNIKLNGSLANASTSQGSPVTISYILNEDATAGVTIKVLSGATVVRTINIPAGSPGALRRTNSVVWDGKSDANANVPPGTYSVSITASATGYADWTQTSIDNEVIGGTTNHFAFFPYGMDVDRNTNSPYYGRVVVASAASDNTQSAVGKRRGLYKMNADGSPADEGWYGNAGYLTNDYGVVSTIGEMPAGKSTGHKVPATVRIGEDDRIYFMDNSQIGCIVATDIKATTNQVVITSGNFAKDQSGGAGTSFDFSHLFCQSLPASTSVGCGGDHNYQDCPLIQNLDAAGIGLEQFDVCGLGTSNAAVYMVDSGDFPSWGIWCFRLDNATGQSDTNETVGCQVVYTGGDPVVSNGGIMVDYNLNIFHGSNRGNAGDPLHRLFRWNDWGAMGGTSGSLPPPNSSGFTAFANGGPAPAWQIGSGDDYMSAIWDTAIDSRTHPNLVACAMAQSSANVAGGFSGKNGGIRIVSADDGSIVKTNLDLANWYNDVAFDNVGNVYGASRSSNRWRTWSPPGPNTNTTTAVFGIQVSAAATAAHITTTVVSGGNVSITFTADPSDSASAFTLLAAATVHGSYTPVGVSATQVSPGTFNFTVPVNGGTQFYQISR